MLPRTRLHPPSVSQVESGGAWEGSTPWPGVFDEPATVERAWVDLVAERPLEERHDLQRALAFARARHGGQTRRGSDTPYWVHLVRVALALVRWSEADPALLQAALLHDVVEDTPTTLAEVEAGFGPEVASLVEWLTWPSRPGESERSYYARFHAAAPPKARVLKIADRSDNLRSQQALLMRAGPGHAAWARRYLERTRWQVRPLVQRASSAGRVELFIAMADLAAAIDDVEPNIDMVSGSERAPAAS